MQDRDLSAAVFLFDVDNTLLDNDRIRADLGDRVGALFGPAATSRYWELYEELRQRVGYADYLGALQRFRLECADNVRAQELASFMLDYPFRDRLVPNALAAIAHLGTFGKCVVLSDGDAVLQPWKIGRSGIADAVGGRVLVYVHKEQVLDDVARRFPATHYLMFDDKLAILEAMKQKWQGLLTTVFVRQGHYANAPDVRLNHRPADIEVGAIGELLGFDAGTLRSAARTANSRE